MKKEGGLSKIGEGVIDNQWFKWPKMTIVPRPFEESSKTAMLKVERPLRSKMKAEGAD